MTTRSLLLVLLFLLVALPGAGSAHIVTIHVPDNTTYFNQTVDLKVTSNETTATNWTYIIDGKAYVNFTLNSTIVNLTQGSHTLNVTGNYSDTFNSSFVNFTVAYVYVRLVDEDSGLAIPGINTKILYSNKTTATSENSSATGYSNHTVPAYGTYYVQGGQSGTDYSRVRSFSFDFDISTEAQIVRLIRYGDGDTVYLQFIDYDYGTPVEGATIKLYVGTDVVNEVTTDAYGYISDYLIAGKFYRINATMTGYDELSTSQLVTATSYTYTMRRTELPTLDVSAPYVEIYPKNQKIIPNSSLPLAMLIYDESAFLTNYGIVYGTDADYIQDDDVPYLTGFKTLACSGTHSYGELLECPPIDLRTWNETSMVVGYYYTRNSTKHWTTQKFMIGTEAQVQYGPIPFSWGSLNPYQYFNPWTVRNPMGKLMDMAYMLGFGDFAINIIVIFIITAITSIGALAGGFGGAVIAGTLSTIIAVVISAFTEPEYGISTLFIMVVVCFTYSRYSGGIE